MHISEHHTDPYICTIPTIFIHRLNINVGNKEDRTWQRPGEQWSGKQSCKSSLGHWPWAVTVGAAPLSVWKGSCASVCIHIAVSFSYNTVFFPINFISVSTSPSTVYIAIPRVDSVLSYYFPASGSLCTTPGPYSLELSKL